MTDFVIQVGEFGLREDARVLGEGSLGTVFEGIHYPSGLPVAIKVIDKTKLSLPELTLFKHHMELVRRAGYHQNIVTVHAVHENEQELYVVAELMTEDLFSFITRDDTNKQNIPSPKGGDNAFVLEKTLFRQLAEAIAYCHYHGIAHHDLKLENCLIDNQLRLKITDFCACEVTPPHLASHNNNFGPAQETKLTDCRAGSDGYFPPEVLEGKPHDAKAVDIWAMGVILYALVKRTFPFAPDDLDALYEQVSSPEYIDEMLAAQIEDNALRDLLAAMLTPDPDERCGINDVLLHPWLKTTGGGFVSHSLSATVITSAGPCSPQSTVMLPASPSSLPPACDVALSPPVRYSNSLWLASNFRRD